MSTDSDFDLDAAVEDVRTRAAEVGRSDPRRLQLCGCLAMLLLDKFGETQDMGCLNEAIQAMREAMFEPSLAPNVDHAFAAQLGGLLFARFQETSGTDDRDDAIDLLSTAITDLPNYRNDEEAQMRTYYLKALEGLLSHRYTTNKAICAQVPLDDMDAALRYGNLALLGPDTDQGRVEYISHLAQLCWTAFQAGGDVAFVEQAIRHLRSGLAIRNGATSNDRATCMMNISEFSWALFQRNQAPELLDQSISAGQGAATEDPTAVPCDFWHKLSWRLKLRHEATGSMDDLDEAIKSAHRAVELAPDNHPARPSYGKNLASRLTTKYLKTNSSEDLEAVIGSNRAALDTAPPGSTVRAELLNNLGLTLFYRFERDSRLCDLDECVQLLKDSVALSTPPDEAWRRRLANLIPRVLHRNSGEEVEGKLFTIVPNYDGVYQAAESPSRITDYAFATAAMLNVVYTQTRNTATLDDAICLSHEAQRATANGDPARPSRVMLLCTLLQEKAELSRDLDDIEAAVTHWNLAVNITDPPPHYEPQSLLGLSSALLLKHTIQDDEEASVIYASMRAAASAFCSAAPDDPRKQEYRIHMQQYPGINHDPTLPVRKPKHECNNCKSLREFLSSAPANHSVSWKKLGFEEETGQLVPQPFTSEDGELLPNLVQRMVFHDSEPSKANKSTEAPSDCSPSARARTGGRRAVRIIDLSEIENKAPLPDQAEFYSQRFFQLGSLSDLDVAISIQNFVVESTSGGHSGRGTYCANLAAWFHARYQVTHMTEDLDKAIEFGLLAVDDTSCPESEMTGRHSNLAVFYASRSEAQSSASDLEQTILHRRKAREAYHGIGENSHALGISLADDLHWRFRLHSERTDLDEAIGLLQEAIDSCGCSEDRVILLGNLSSWYTERYHVFGSLNDLDVATRKARLAEEACQSFPQHLPSVRFSLAQALYFKFEVTCEVEELQSAIQIVTDICDGEPSAEDEDARTLWLASLGNFLCLRGAMMLDSHDLNESIRMCRKAIASQPRGSSRSAFLFRNLGHCLGMRYQHTGRVQDIEEAIASVERASRMESANKSTRARSDAFIIPDGLDELGTLYFCRFNALGARRDLDESIRLGRDSLDTNTRFMFRGHPRRCQALVNLGNRYGLRYLRFSHAKLDDAESLWEAISHTRRALEEEEAAGTDNMSATMPSFARWILVAAEAQQDSTLLRRYIALLEDKLRQSPERQFRRRIEISTVLSRFYLAASKLEERARAEADLEQARLLADAAANLVTPSWGVKRSEILHLLADILRQKASVRKKDSGSLTLIETAARNFLESSRSTGAPLRFRIIGAMAAGECFADLGRWKESTDAFQTALRALPLLVPQSIQRDDQEDALRQIGALSSSAATAAIQAGKEASFALLQLEAGRGVISSLLIKSRSDISLLEAVRPELAERYETLRLRCAQLHPAEGGGATTTASPSGSQQPGVLYGGERISRIQEDLRELAVLEHTIRGVAGFEDFQSQLSVEQITRLASSGILVSFNVSKWGSHAFYVSKDKKIGSISLPDLVMADVQRNLQLLIGKERLALGTPSSRPARNKVLCGILAWLWSAAVEPVLRELDLLSPANAPRLPRLFWVACGPMGSMPIHAAGNVFDGGTARASQYVVSTYVPTLNSLGYARKLVARRKAFVGDLQTLISAGQDLSSDRASSRVLNVQEEIAAVKIAASAAQMPAPTVSTATSKTEILEQMEGQIIVHFACHGKSCPDRPSDSGLFVGVGEHPDVPLLRVRDLAALSYDNARLAFLSACSTAEISAQSLVDEAMHVASAFQIAGFPHVIGTLWEAEDRATIALAARFYDRLFRSLGSAKEWDDDAVAYALHDAVEALQSEGLPGSRRRISLYSDPLIWAPFIHIGI